jgi:hypothetical protein
MSAKFIAGPYATVALFAAGLLCPSFAAFAEHRLVSIGGRRLSIDCDGARTHRDTVVLIPGLGRTAKDWEKVQPAVADVARVCRYDLARLGESDNPQSFGRTQNCVSIWWAIVTRSSLG